MEINRNNYEEFFMLYLDRELSPSGNREVENFLAQNTDLQKEFAAWQMTILTPADILFEQKEALFHKEEKRRVIPFYRMRVAAAIALLLVSGWLTITVIRNRSQETQPLKETAATEPVASKQSAEKQSDTVSGGLNNNPFAEQRVKKTSAVKRYQQQQPVTGIELKNKDEVKTEKAQRVQEQRSNDTEQPSLVSDQDERLLAQIKPAHTNLQQAEIQTGKTLSALPEIKPASQTIVTAGIIQTAAIIPAKVENQTDPYAQTDNAISVVALNEKNKSITGFFKKLTKRTPSDVNDRKVRVSVFQISY